MTAQSRTLVRPAAASALLLGALLGCHATGAGDELSLVQTSVVRAVTTEEASRQPSEADFNEVFRRRGYNATSLLALHGFPGVKSMKDQLKEAQGFKMPEPEQGYHKKIVKALPVLKEGCSSKAYATEEDCRRAVDLITMLGKISEGPEPMWTWHGQIRLMVGIHFWLYTPGTMIVFTLLDMDRSKGITYEELTRIFGPQAMSSMNPVWKHLDQDGDGGITREELHNYLRAAILVRDVLPDLDGIDPKAPTLKCMNMAHRVLAPPAMPMKKMKFYPKLLSIAGIVIGAFAVHCLLCSGSSKKTIDREVDAAEKDPASKK